ncbi:hypothetical protein [Limnobaculum parvum]|uniref:hypothetical protein n=1 Tax=Limnobaculum parvum TaxID=2172103 RepID=UPI001300AD93|nr:hypothetical protein [Limnobaculum parvum]
MSIVQVAELSGLANSLNNPALSHPNSGRLWRLPSAFVRVYAPALIRSRRSSATTNIHVGRAPSLSCRLNSSAQQIDQGIRAKSGTKN